MPDFHSRAEIQLNSGDILRKVNGQGVDNVLDFYRAFNDGKSGEILFTI